MRVEENWRGGLLHNIVYLWVSLVAFGHEGNHVDTYVIFASCPCPLIPSPPRAGAELHCITTSQHCAHSKGLSPRTVKIQKGASGCHESGFCLQAGTLIPVFTWSPLEEERENSSEAVFWIPVVSPPVWSQTQEP